MTTPAPTCPDCGTEWSTDCPRNRPAGADVSRAHSAPLLVSIP